MWRIVLRRNSGPRRNLPHVQKTRVEDYETEEQFQDAVDIATLRKGRPELYHFEDVRPSDSRVYANDKFKFVEMPLKWKSHEEYYKAAIEERKKQLEQFHPEDWELDHDHRLMWFGMVREGDLGEWEIEEKKSVKQTNIGFKRPRAAKTETEALSSEDAKRIKKALLLGQHDIDSVAATRKFMETGDRLDFVDTVQAHYNIQHDQFGPGRHFYSVVPFGVSFGEKGVFCGNELFPVDMQSAPEFTIGSSAGALFTVVFSSLDSNVVENGKNELLHYAVSNVTSESTGDVWMDYLQPIPARGSGYHRLVATLYHQTEPIENVEKVEETLSGRQFDSAQYLAANQAVLTPAAFCFSQVRWDASVKSVYHDHLRMPEPVYSYPKDDLFPIERPEGIPQGVEQSVIDTWFPTEPVYPTRLRQTKKQKLKMPNYLGHDQYRNYLRWRQAE